MNPPSSALAVWSLSLGIVSILLLGPLTGIPAIVCGHIARANIEKEPEKFSGKGMATAGLVTGYIGTLWLLAILALFFSLFVVAGRTVEPFVYTLF